MKSSHLLAAICLCLLLCSICSAQFYPLSGSLRYPGIVNQVMDVSPDGKLAVALMDDPNHSHAALLETFDPISGKIFDSKSFGSGPEEVQLVKVGAGYRVVALTSEGGPRAAYLFEVGPTGQLTQLTKTSLTTSNGDANSNLVLSSDPQVGFVIVDSPDPFAGSDVVTFSLVSGAILNRYTITNGTDTIIMSEMAGKRTLALFNLQVKQGVTEISLGLLDASNPAQLVDAGTIPLSTIQPGVGYYPPGYAVSSNGRYLFIGEANAVFSVVDLSTKQVIGTLPGYRVYRVSLFEDGRKRLLALKASKGNESQIQAVLVDATDLTKLSVLNQYNFTGDTRSDLTFSEDGLHLILGEQKEMTALAVPSLSVEWKKPVRASATHQQIISFGQDVLGAWNASLGLGFNAYFGAFPLSQPNVSISSDVSVTESDTAKAEFHITLSAPTTHKVTVAYTTTTGGTASQSFDFPGTAGTVTFEPGETTKTISINILNDSIDEFDETFPVVLTSASVGILQRAQAICTIVDDDPPVPVSINDTSVIEGNAGTRNISFTVNLSAQSSKPVTVDYVTSDGTAIAGSDYVSTTGTVSFSPGQTQKTISMLVNGDTRNEPNEAFTVNLTNPQNGSLARSQAVGTIVNDDTPFIRLSSSTYTINEGAVNTSQSFSSLTVNVIRGGDTSAPATVQYFTSDQSGGNECNQVTGQASQRCDYATQAGTLRFAAGEGGKTISISIINDGYQEGNESFKITLSNPTGGTILGANNEATITIEDRGLATTSAENLYLSNEFFIRMNYLDFLGREPDPEGWNTWTTVLNNCGPEKGFLGAPKSCDRAFVTHGFVASPEFTDRGYLIHRMYEIGLGRLPRYSEFVPDMAAMSGTPGSQELAQNSAQFAENFTARQDFLNRYGSVSSQSQAAQLIQLLEQVAGVSLPETTTTLPGQPQQYNRQDLINKRLSGEFTLGQTLKAFVEQKAVYDKYFERGFVTMMYFGFLRRDPDLNDPTLAGWTEWVFVFTNGGAQRNRPDIGARDIHHLMFGFIYSEEYRKRFGQP